MFKSMFTLFLFAITVFAQGADIGLPGYNQTVKSGSELTVQVQLPVCPITLRISFSMLPPATPH